MAFGSKRKLVYQNDVQEADASYSEKTSSEKRRQVKPLHNSYCQPLRRLARLMSFRSSLIMHLIAKLRAEKFRE
jgi:hypothetical protein